MMKMTEGDGQRGEHKEQIGSMRCRARQKGGLRIRDRAKMVHPSNFYSPKENLWELPACV